MEFIQTTAKAWVGGLVTVAGGFILQYMSTPEAGTVINNVVQEGFDWQNAGLRSFIAGAVTGFIVWLQKNKVA